MSTPLLFKPRDPKDMEEVRHMLIKFFKERLKSDNERRAKAHDIFKLLMGTAQKMTNTMRKEGR